MPLAILVLQSHIYGTDQPTMETGSRGRYFWLTSADHDLDYLLMSCPQIILAKYLAVTSFDSGSLVPNEDKVIAGWESRGGIAYGREAAARPLR